MHDPIPLEEPVTTVRFAVYVAVCQHGDCEAQVNGSLPLCQLWEVEHHALTGHDAVYMHKTTLELIREAQVV